MTILALSIAMLGMIYAAIIDIKQRHIPIVSYIIIGVAGVLNILSGGIEWWYAAISFVLFFIVMILASSFMKNSIGGGDIKLISLCCLIYGATHTVIQFIVATVIMIICQLVLRKGRNTPLPFAPALTVGYLISAIMYI